MRRRAAAAATVALVAWASAGCSDDSEGSFGGSGGSLTDDSSAVEEPDTGVPETETETEAESEAEPEDEGGSGGSTVLDDFVAEVDAGVEDALGPMADAYSDVRVEAVPPSGIEYIYVFAEEVDPDEATAQFDSSASMLETTFENQVAPSMEQAGIDSPSATWTYQNPDGSEIWSRTFS